MEGLARVSTGTGSAVGGKGSYFRGGKETDVNDINGFVVDGPIEGIAEVTGQF